jgi:hypothetical protein
MEKTLQAAIRARLEAAGITGFYINTGSFAAGIKQPDFIGFIPLSGTSGAALQSFDAGPDGTLVPRDWSLGPRQKRTAALKSADIKMIEGTELDALLTPLMTYGLLRTTYERCTGAIEYRGPSGRVIAVSIGSHHFARRDAGAFSFAMHAQQVGRIKRHTDASRPQ